MFRLINIGCTDGLSDIAQCSVLGQDRSFEEHTLFDQYCLSVLSAVQVCCECGSVCLVQYIEVSVRFLLATFKEGYGNTVELCYNIMK